MYISSDERTGLFTFQAEGSTDPHNPYFIGKLSHPSPASGVTIGAGYDMGGRNAIQVEYELVSAGLSSFVAAKLAKGAGLTGHPAAKFVADNMDIRIEDIQILRNLFAMDFPRYVTRASNYFAYHAATFHSHMSSYGKMYSKAVQFTWDTLYPSIRVIAIDFAYQGFGRMAGGYGKPMHFCMANDFDWLIGYIQHTPGLSRYEAGRHRASYLQTNKALEMRNYSNSIPETRVV